MKEYINSIDQPPKVSDSDMHGMVIAVDQEGEEREVHWSEVVDNPCKFIQWAKIIKEMA